jgi:transcriptional regulator with XRE-family HTH domain
MPHPTATREPGSRSPTEIDEFVGERIRAIRNERRLTLHDVATALAISHQQLQKYETGANRLSAGMLWQVAQYFQISIASLFPDAPKDVAAEALKAKRTLDAIRRIVREGV